MKTYLFGIATGIILSVAVHYRSKWWPTAKTETEKIIDRLAKK